MIVLDQVDASGMFSKAGRQSLEMFTMLLEKEHLLPSSSNSNKNLRSIDTLKKHLKVLTPIVMSSSSAATLSRNAIQQQPSSTQNQPFFKAVSRESRQLQQQNKESSDKFGMYNPQFHCVYEKSALYPDKYEEENKQRAREARETFKYAPPRKVKKPGLSAHIGFDPCSSSSNNNNSLNSSMSKLGGGNSSGTQPTDSSLLGIDFDKPRKHIASPVPLDKQANRRPLAFVTPHERRFDMLETSFVSSKTPHITSVKFSSAVRDTSNIFGNKKPGGLDYDVSYAAVHTRSSIGVPNLSKQTARSPPVKKVSTNSKAPPFTDEGGEDDGNSYYITSGTRRHTQPYRTHQQEGNSLIAAHDAKLREIAARQKKYMSISQPPKFGL